MRLQPKLRGRASQATSGAQNCDFAAKTAGVQFPYTFGLKRSEDTISEPELPRTDEFSVPFLSALSSKVGL